MAQAEHRAAGDGTFNAVTEVADVAVDAHDVCCVGNDSEATSISPSVRRHGDPLLGRREVHFHSLLVGAPRGVRVVPNQVSTTIDEMITSQESAPAVSVSDWREVPKTPSGG